MTELKLKLIVEVSGDTLHEIDDKLTQYVGERIKSRIVANPQQAINAQRGICPDMPEGLKIKPLANIPKAVNDAIDNKIKKSSFEEV